MSRDDDLEALVTVVIDMGLRLHQGLGPGLLESAYEMILFEKRRQRVLRSRDSYRSVC